VQRAALRERWERGLALKMFLARMFSTQAKHTVWSQGLKPTDAGTSFLQILREGARHRGR
jgi:hypothetical protein